MNDDLKRILVMSGLALGGIAIGFSINTTVDRLAWYIVGSLLVGTGAFLHGRQVQLDRRRMKG